MDRDPHSPVKMINQLQKLHFKLFPTWTLSGKKAKYSNAGSMVLFTCISLINSIAFLLPSLQSVVRTRTMHCAHFLPSRKHQSQAWSHGEWLGWLFSAHAVQMFLLSKHSSQELLQSPSRNSTVSSFAGVRSKQPLHNCRVFICPIRSSFVSSPVLSPLVW